MKMIKNKISSQSLLSTLWVFILMNMIFRDIHQFGKSGFIEEMMNGIVNGVKITEELMLLGGFLAEVPIIMILLSRILPNKANKWANIIASLLTLLILVIGLPSADMDDVFFIIIELIAFLFIIRIASRLPTQSKIKN